VKNVNRVAVVALWLSACAYSQGVFSVVKVPGSSPNSVTAINSGGQVLVNTGNSSSYQVSTWGRINGAENIGLTGTNSGGAGINSSGDVVGAGDPDHSGNLQAFVWRPTSGVQWLGSLGGNLSAASGINDSGAVVGLSYTAANTQHAFLWTAAGGMQDLTPGLSSSSIGGATAVAINATNQVVGYYFPNGSLNTVGFLWTQAGGLQNLGPAGTLALAINSSGTVVGQSPVATYRHAFSWTQAGGMKDLGTLGGDESTALSINSKGWIAGTSLTTGNGVQHGFLWTPTGGMQDLTALAGLAAKQQAYSVEVNDAGVVAISTSRGDLVLVPKMTATFSSSANPSVLGQAVTFTAKLTSIAGPPPDGETVEFVVSGQVLGSAQLKGGVAEFTTSAIPVGTHAVVAEYSGDGNYLPTKYNALGQVVNK
jgi:probable HAF family extracellular repeat protein